MLEVFRKYIESKVTLSDEEWALIGSVCIIKKLRKQQFLLQEGDVWRYHAFVCQGCLRRYSIDDKGIEHILQFSLQNWWAGDRESLMNGITNKSEEASFVTGATLTVDGSQMRKWVISESVRPHQYFFVINKMSDSFQCHSS